MGDRSPRSGRCASRRNPDAAREASYRAICRAAGVVVALLPNRPRPAFFGLAGLAALVALDVGYQVVAGDPPFASFLATLVAIPTV